MLPNTMVCTFTAVPQSPGISFIRRYTIARGLSQERNTAFTASISCYYRILWELLAHMLLCKQLLETCDQFLQIICSPALCRTLRPLLCLDLIDDRSQNWLLRNLHNNVGEHLDKSSVRIICKSRIAGLLCEALYSIHRSDPGSGWYPSYLAWKHVHQNERKQAADPLRIAKLLAVDLF